MPEFTVVLKDAIARRTADLTIDECVGLDSYPIFDPAYRGPLNAKIIEHFQFREIGAETVEMFRVFVRRKMNEIMPLYNQFYESQILAVEPFITFDTTTDTENNSISTATNSSVAESKARAVSQDFPQTLLSEVGDYASDASNNVANSENTAEADTTDESTGSVNTRGFSGAMSDLLLRYRETFLNIDMQVIAELDVCFMGLWSNGDETFSYPYGSTGWGF